MESIAAPQRKEQTLCIGRWSIRDGKVEPVQQNHWRKKATRSRIRLWSRRPATTDLTNAVAARSRRDDLKVDDASSNSPGLKDLPTDTPSGGQGGTVPFGKEPPAGIATESPRAETRQWTTLTRRLLTQSLPSRTEAAFSTCLAPILAQTMIRTIEPRTSAAANPLPADRHRGVFGSTTPARRRRRRRRRPAARRLREPDVARASRATRSLLLQLRSSMNSQFPCDGPERGGRRSLSNAVNSVTQQTSTPAKKLA